MDIFKPSLRPYYLPQFTSAALFNIVQRQCACQAMTLALPCLSCNTSSAVSSLAMPTGHPTVCCLTTKAPHLHKSSSQVMQIDQCLPSVMTYSWICAIMNLLPASEAMTCSASSCKGSSSNPYLHTLWTNQWLLLRRQLLTVRLANCQTVQISADLYDDLQRAGWEDHHWGGGGLAEGSLLGEGSTVRRACLFVSDEDTGIGGHVVSTILHWVFSAPAELESDKDIWVLLWGCCCLKLQEMQVSALPLHHLCKGRELMRIARVAWTYVFAKCSSSTPSHICLVSVADSLLCQCPPLHHKGFFAFSTPPAKQKSLFINLEDRIWGAKVISNGLLSYRFSPNALFFVFLGRLGWQGRSRNCVQSKCVCWLHQAGDDAAFSRGQFAGHGMSPCLCSVSRSLCLSLYIHIYIYAGELVLVPLFWPFKS